MQQRHAAAEKVDAQLTHIGTNRVAVPHGFFKAVLAEKAKPKSKHQLDMWCFEMPNQPARLKANKEAGKALKDRKGRMWSLKEDTRQP